MAPPRAGGQSQAEWLANEVAIYAAEGWPLGCTLWPLDGRARETVRFAGRRYIHYRLAWYFTYGTWPVHTIDHVAERCSSPRCFNVTHLEDVTNGENTHRMLLVMRSKPCPRGHARTPANTWVGKDNKRKCRACSRERKQEKRRAE